LPTINFIYNEGDKIIMDDILKTGFILTIILMVIVVFSCLATGNEGYLESSVEYPEQIEPSPIVDYGSNSQTGISHEPQTNTATPEPDDQEDGYSEDNEDLESA